MALWDASHWNPSLAPGCAGGQNGAGGGGGAGYTDGSVTVVDTQLGGSTGNCKVVIRSVT